MLISLVDPSLYVIHNIIRVYIAVENYESEHTSEEWVNLLISCRLHEGGDGSRLHNLEGKQKFIDTVFQKKSPANHNSKDHPVVTPANTDDVSKKPDIHSAAPPTKKDDVIKDSTAIGRILPELMVKANPHLRFDDILNTMVMVVRRKPTLAKLCSQKLMQHVKQKDKIPDELVQLFDFVHFGLGLRQDDSMLRLITYKLRSICNWTYEVIV